MTFGVLFIGAVLACILLNGLVIIVLLKKKNITYMDMIVVSLSASDLLQAAIGYSMEIHSYYNNSSTISDVPCKFAGFAVTFLALVSISHLVGIAIERRCIMKHPIKARLWSNQSVIALYVIIPSWLYGFLWAISPFLGWNEYVRETISPHRCNIDLMNHEANHLSYLYSLLVLCFLVPVIIIIFCCHSIYSVINNMRNQSHRLGLPQHMTISRRKLKTKQTLMSMVMIIAFLLAWTPYALCVLALSANGNVPPKLYSAAAIFAKMSTLYNPIIYICFMGSFRAHFKRVFGCHSNEVVPLGNARNVTISSREGNSRRLTSSITTALQSTDATTFPMGRFI